MIINRGFLKEYALKNLGKTIDRILKIDPTLEEKLIAIKNKWRRYPSKTMDYWQELLTYLNSEHVINNTKRTEIKEVLISTSPRRQHIYSFEDCTSFDRIIGAIPENLVDKVRHHDLKSIALAKMRVEADITKNSVLLAKVLRKEAIQELNTKKLWIALRDHFNLWEKQTSISIKKNRDLIVLVDTSNAPPSFVGQNLVKMDQDTLRQFMKFLGLEPPSSPDQQ